VCVRDEYVTGYIHDYSSGTHLCEWKQLILFSLLGAGTFFFFPFTFFFFTKKRKKFKFEVGEK